MDVSDRALPTYPFAGIPTFLRAPIQSDLARLDADIAVVGIPTDEGSPFLPGSRLGPRGIREHSLRFGAGGFYDGRDGREYVAAALRDARSGHPRDVDGPATAAVSQSHHPNARPP